MSAHISIRTGAVHLPAAVAETYFAGISAVVVLIREGAVLILPVHGATGGGCILKVRNAAGDRVALAPDVFFANGLKAWVAEDLPARWDSAQSALCAAIPAQVPINFTIEEVDRHKTD